MINHTENTNTSKKKILIKKKCTISINNDWLIMY